MYDCMEGQKYKKKKTIKNCINVWTDKRFRKCINVWTNKPYIKNDRKKMNKCMDR